MSITDMEFIWRVLLLLIFWCSTNFISMLNGHYANSDILHDIYEGVIMTGLENSIPIIPPPEKYILKARRITNEEPSKLPATWIQNTKDVLRMKVNMGKSNQLRHVIYEDCFVWDMFIEKKPLPQDNVNYTKCLEKEVISTTIPPPESTTEKPPASSMVLPVYANPHMTKYVSLGNRTFLVSLWLRLLERSKSCMRGDDQELSQTQFPLRKGVYTKNIRDENGVCWKCSVQIDPTSKPEKPAQVVPLVDRFVNVYFDNGLPPPSSTPETSVITMTKPGECYTHTRNVQDRSQKAWMVVVQVCGVGPHTGTNSILNVQSSYELTIRFEGSQSYVRLVKDANGLVWAIAVAVIEKEGKQPSWPTAEEIRLNIDFSKVKKSPAPPPPSLPSSKTINFVATPQPIASEPSKPKCFTLVDVVSDQDTQPWEIRLTVTPANQTRLPDFQVVGDVMTVTVDLEEEGAMHNTVVDQRGVTYDLYVSLIKCGLGCQPQQMASPDNVAKVKVDLRDVNRILFEKDKCKSDCDTVEVVSAKQPPPSTAFVTGVVKVAAMPFYPFPMPDISDAQTWYVDSERSFVNKIEDGVGRKWKVELALGPGDPSTVPDFNCADALLKVAVPLGQPYQRSKTVIDRNGGLWNLNIKESQLPKDEVVKARTPTNQLVLVLDLTRLRRERQENLQVEQKHDRMGFGYVLVPPASNMVPSYKLNSDQSRENQFVVEKKGEYWSVYAEIKKIDKPVGPIINVGNCILKMKFDFKQPFELRATVVTSALNYWSLVIKVSRMNEDAVPQVYLPDDESFYIHNDFRKLQMPTSQQVTRGIYTTIYQPAVNKLFTQTQRRTAERSMTVADNSGNLWDLMVTMNELPYYQSPEKDTGNELKLKVVLMKEEERKFVVAESNSRVWSVMVSLKKSAGGKPVLLTAAKNFFYFTLKFESNEFMNNNYPWLDEQMITPGIINESSENEQTVNN